MVKKLIVKPIEKAEIDIDELLSKGAPVKEDIVLEKEESKWSNVNFRLPTEMLQTVDEVLRDRVGISRNGWLQEAVNEKLLRSGKAYKILNKD